MNIQNFMIKVIAAIRDSINSPAGAGSRLKIISKAYSCRNYLASLTAMMPPGPPLDI